MGRLRIRFPHNHRPRPAAPALRVDPQGDWKACTATIPRACSVIGTVTSDGTTGALVKLAHTGAYVKVIAGEIQMVNQLKVEQALAALRDRALLQALEMVSVDDAAQADQ